MHNEHRAIEDRLGATPRGCTSTRRRLESQTEVISDLMSPSRCAGSQIGAMYVHPVDRPHDVSHLGGDGAALGAAALRSRHRGRGRRVARRRDDAGHRSGHGRAGRHRGGGVAADVERAVRSARAAFDDGRWRHLAPLEKERRLRRLAALLAERGDVFGELDVIDAGLLRGYTTFIVAVRGRRASSTTRAGRRSCRARSRRSRPSSPSTRCASRSAWSG